MRLTLSGGGFRAALFHLGVIRYLHERNKLREVTHICSVSGGSVLAAHLVLNWHRYVSNKEKDNDKEQDFRAAADEVVRFVQRDVRGRVVRAWICSWLAAVCCVLAPLLFLTPWVQALLVRWLPSSMLPCLTSYVVFVSLGWELLVWWLIIRYKESWSLIRWLQREYETQLYPRKELRHLASDQTAPQLYVLATNFTTGQMCAFHHDGFYVHKKDGTPPTPHPNNNLPVALAVAASSSFPALFSPVRLTQQDFPANDYFSVPCALTDGGVYENLGIRGDQVFCQRTAEVLPPPPKGLGLIISDGQGRFVTSAPRGYGLVNSRAVRATDVLMHRVCGFELEGHKASLFCLQTSVEDQRALTPTARARVADLRTDLDSFSDLEVECLVYAGYSTARYARDEDNRQEGPGKCTCPPPKAYAGGWTPTKAKLADSASAILPKLARGNTGRLGLWRWWDVSSWFTALQLLLLVGPLIALLVAQWISKPPPPPPVVRCAYAGDVSRDGMLALPREDVVQSHPWMMKGVDQQLAMYYKGPRVYIRSEPFVGKVGRCKCELISTGKVKMVAAYLFVTDGHSLRALPGVREPGGFHVELSEAQAGSYIVGFVAVSEVPEQKSEYHDEFEIRLSPDH
jgi:predicted acylesterase/phospholipase RssA